LIKTDEYGNKVWDRIFEFGFYSMGRSVKQTSDGGYIITGTKDYELFLLKTDNSGNTQWEKTYGGKYSSDGNSVQQTIDDGYIITGSKRSISLDYDIWLIKTDSNGNEIWNKTFGTSNDDRGYSVQQTIDGGFIIACNLRSYSYPNDAYIIKTDSSGNTQWDKILPGDEENIISEVQLTIDDGYIIVGSTESYGAGNFDIWLIKLGTNTPPDMIMYVYDKIDDSLVILASDNDNDKIRYGISWDNDFSVDYWTEYVSSGTEKRIDCEGRTGYASVIVEDELGAQSDWVSVKSKNKQYNTHFIRFLENHTFLFRLLQRLFKYYL
jgi:hypothetical protein